MIGGGGGRRYRLNSEHAFCPDQEMTTLFSIPDQSLNHFFRSPSLVKCVVMSSVIGMQKIRT